jgi:hypothetical protein
MSLSNGAHHERLNLTALGYPRIRTFVISALEKQKNGVILIIINGALI